MASPSLHTTANLPWTVVLTGGMASGKTTVARYLAERGARVIDADEHVATCLQPGHPCFEAIQQRWPDVVSTHRNPPTLNKPFLRERLALDLNDRDWLERLLHPHVRQRMAAARSEPTDTRYDVLVVPLLVEHLASHPNAYPANRLCTVECERTTQVARALARDPSLQPNVLNALLTRQASPAERRAVADDVLCNDGSLSDLLANAATLHNQWSTLAHVAANNPPPPNGQQPP